MPVPRNCNITVLPAGSFWCLFICRTLGSEQLFWFCCKPNAAYRKSCWIYHRMGIDSGIGLWYHVSGGECVRFDGPPHHFYLDYHRMGIDNAGILCYIGSTEVNRCVPLGQLEPDSMKQPVGFFFAVAKQIPPEHLICKKVPAVFFPIQTCHSCYNIKAIAPTQVERHNNRVSIGIRYRCNDNRSVWDSIRFQQFCPH